MTVPLAPGVRTRIRRKRGRFKFGCARMAKQYPSYVRMRREILLCKSDSLYFSLYLITNIFFTLFEMKNPGQALYYTNRALCHLKLKRWESVCKDCRWALDIDPCLMKGHFFLGLALLELELFDEAVKYLQRGKYNETNLHSLAISSSVKQIYNAKLYLSQTT